MSAQRRPLPAASRFVPAAGILVGLVGAAAYWGAAQLWPTSIAVVISMLATVLATANLGRGASTGVDPAAAESASPSGFGALYWTFVLFIKYNTLMALSAAHGLLALPDFLTLGLIMVAGQAASHALVVSVMATDAPVVPRATTGDLIIGLLAGLAPATLLGIPGLIGLVSAIVVRLGLTSRILPKFQHTPRQRLQVVQHLTEACFYLGMLASWKYI